MPVFPEAAWSIEDWKSASDIAANLITAAAVIAGAVWAYWRFVRERTRWPRAAVELVFGERMLDPRTRFVRIWVNVKNEGRGRMSLSELRLDVYRVLPLVEKMRKAIECENQFSPGEVEADWPLLELRKKDCSEGKAELEPGETDEFVFDFFLSSKVHTISVYAYLENAAKSRRFWRIWKKPQPLGWSATRLHDLEVLNTAATKASLGEE